RLKNAGQKVVTIGDTANAGGDFTVDPKGPDDYHKVVRALVARQSSPTYIVHLWGVSTDDESEPTAERMETAQDLGFYSLLFLVQALGREDLKHSIKIVVVTNHMQEVVGGELTRPDKATVGGPCRVIP